VTKRSAQSVVTAAAYLLFYRRRSDRPLGSPQLQRIVERALDGEADSDEPVASRSTSPSNDKSGNDGRVDDYSSSSTALIGPVAAPPRKEARSAGASTEPRRMDLADGFTDVDELQEDHGGPMYDEGIALSNSVEFDAHPVRGQQSWADMGFSMLGNDDRPEGDRDEMDSNAAQGSEEDFGAKPNYGEYDELNAQDDSMELLEGTQRISSTPVNEESDIPQQSIEEEVDFQSMQGVSYTHHPKTGP
jgi:hypothetical protein